MTKISIKHVALKVKCPRCYAIVGAPCLLKRPRKNGTHNMTSIHTARKNKALGKVGGEGQEQKVFPVDQFPDPAKKKEEVFKAECIYPAKCKHCLGSIEEGDRIAKREGDSFWIHEKCLKEKMAWDYKLLIIDDVLSPEKEIKKDAPKTPTLIEQIVHIVTTARKIAESHGMGLPVGYRTTKHLASLATIFDSADDAWRLWVDGRVSKPDRAKFDEAGLPSGTYKHRDAEDDDETNPNWYSTLEEIVDEGLPVFLVGEAGTGKTRFAQWYAERAKKDLHVVCGTGDMAGRDLWIARRDVTKGNITTDSARRGC